MRKIPFFFILAAVTYLSLWPRESLDANVSREVQSFADLAHLCFYLAVSSTFLFAWGRRTRSRLWRVRAFLFGAAWGFLMELLQMIPYINRSFQWEDVCFNALGGALGMWLPLWFWKKERTNVA